MLRRAKSEALWPVRTRIFRGNASTIRRLMTSRPSSLGMPISRMTRSGFSLPPEADGIHAIIGIADDLVPFGFQQHLHGHANHGMIVDYQDTAHCLISLPIKIQKKILLSKI